MTSPLPGFPPEVVQVDVEDGAVHLLCADAHFSLDVIFATAFSFIDRCYVTLDRPDAAHHRVTLTAKAAGAAIEELRALVGELASELLAAGWRERVHADNRGLIEAVTRAAFGGALGTPAIDELAALDFGDDPLEDPLGIAVTWEDKYGKPKPEDKP